MDSCSVLSKIQIMSFSLNLACFAGSFTLWDDAAGQGAPPQMYQQPVQQFGMYPGPQQAQHLHMQQYQLQQMHMQQMHMQQMQMQVRTASDQALLHAQLHRCPSAGGCEWPNCVCLLVAAAANGCGGIWSTAVSCPAAAAIWWPSQRGCSGVGHLRQQQTSLSAQS